MTPSPPLRTRPALPPISRSVSICWLFLWDLPTPRSCSAPASEGVQGQWAHSFTSTADLCLPWGPQGSPREVGVAKQPTLGTLLTSLKDGRPRGSHGGGPGFSPQRCQLLEPEEGIRMKRSWRQPPYPPRGFQATRRLSWLLSYKPFPVRRQVPREKG